MKIQVTVLLRPNTPDWLVALGRQLLRTREWPPPTQNAESVFSALHPASPIRRAAAALDKALHAADPPAGDLLGCDVEGAAHIAKRLASLRCAVEQTLPTVKLAVEEIEDSDIASAVTGHVLFGDSLEESVAPLRSKRADLALHRYCRELLLTALDGDEHLEIRKRLGESLSSLAETATCFSVIWGVPPLDRVRKAGADGSTIEGPLAVDWSVDGSHTRPSELEFVDANGTGWSLVQWFADERKLVLCAKCGHLPEICSCTPPVSTATDTDDPRIIVVDPESFFADPMIDSDALREQTGQWVEKTLETIRGSSGGSREGVASRFHLDVPTVRWNTLQDHDHCTAETFRTLVAHAFQPLERWSDCGGWHQAISEPTRQECRSDRLRFLLKLVDSWWSDRDSPSMFDSDFDSVPAKQITVQPPQIDRWIQSQQEVVDCVARRVPIVLCGKYQMVITFVLDWLFEKAGISLSCEFGDEDWRNIILMVGEVSEWPVMVLTRH